MKARKGVKIFLEPGTEVPEWIARHKSASLAIVERAGRKVLLLTIVGGEASFFGGGCVDVRLPGSRQHRVAFEPLKVFEICDLEGRIIASNWYLCQKCFCLTGKKTSERPSELVGHSKANFKCTARFCEYEWVRTV